MVRWLSPGGLFSTAMAVVVAGIFGKYSDKRELEGLQPPDRILSHGSDEDFWFDYVADLGDGWDSTYSVAWLLGQPSIDVEGNRYPRGDLLVMGGDQVYPRAGMDRYRRRLLRPYETVRPRPSMDGAPLYVIPGNHDWSDGLTSFMRIFRNGGFVGDWYVPQSRSYFAAQLPRRWWILGIDVAFDYYIDSAQLTYFRELRFGPSPSSQPSLEGPRIQEGDNIILCTARPGWAEQEIGGDLRVRRGDLGREALRALELEITSRWNCRLRLVLSGDLHHYSRYSVAGADRHRITSGGGGAFLYLTHGLREHVTWGSIESAAEELTLATEYPTKERSRVLRHLIPFGPFVNRSFLALVGGVHLLLASQLPDLIRGSREHVVRSLVELTPTSVLGSLATRPIAQLLSALAWLGLVAFADAQLRIRRIPIGKLVKGSAHFAFQIGAVMLSIAWAADVLGWLRERGLGASIALVGMGIAVFLLGGALGGLVMGIYLWVAHLLGAHGNDAFAALHMTGYKNFLRLRIDRHGNLTVHAIGIEKACKCWQTGPEPSASPIQPVEDLGCHLIDEVEVPGLH